MVEHWVYWRPRNQLSPSVHHAQLEQTTNEPPDLEDQEAETAQVAVSDLNAKGQWDAESHAFLPWQMRMQLQG